MLPLYNYFLILYSYTVQANFVYLSDNFPIFFLHPLSSLYPSVSLSFCSRHFIFLFFPRLMSFLLRLPLSFPPSTFFFLSSSTPTHRLSFLSVCPCGRSNFFDPPGNGNRNGSLQSQVLSIRIKCYLFAKTIHKHKIYSN